MISLGDVPVSFLFSSFIQAICHHCIGSNLKTVSVYSDTEFVYMALQCKLVLPSLTPM